MGFRVCVFFSLHANLADDFNLFIYYYYFRRLVILASGLLEYWVATTCVVRRIFLLEYILFSGNG